MITTLQYSSELASVKGNESNLEAFCKEFRGFEELTILERIELLDDLVRPDLGVSNMAVILLPQLLDVARLTNGAIRFALFTAIADIQRGLICDEVDNSVVDTKLYNQTAVAESCRELRSLLSYSHSEAWRCGVLELLSELEEYNKTN